MRMLFNETIVLHIYLLDWFILVELFVRVAKDVEQDLVWKNLNAIKWWEKIQIQQVILYEF